MVAAAGLLLAALFQAPRLLETRFGNPPAPAPSYYRPGVPYDANSYTKQTKASEEPTDSTGATPRHAEKKETPPRIAHSRAVALATLNRPSDAQASASTQTASAVRNSHLSTHNN